MNEADRSRLEDMLEAALAALEFAEDKARVSLETDKQFQYAIRKAIEVIGEAASKVSQETREQNPQIAWQSIIGMRNVFTHVYMHIDYDRVWDVVTEDLPPLITQLEEIIPPDDAQI